MKEEAKVKIHFDKAKFKEKLFKWINERKCNTCEFEEQKEWKYTQMPVCAICEEDYWMIKETLFDKLVSDCTHVINGEEE